MNLRRHAAANRPAAAQDAWRLRTGLLTLGAATVATAFVSELLVHSLNAFGHALGLSQFFVAAVIVAIVGNAAEQGGAIVVAKRGNTRLAAEIAISSSAQIAVFVAPAIAAAVGARRPRACRLRSDPSSSRRWGSRPSPSPLRRDHGPVVERSEGGLLVGVYAARSVVWFALAGDR